MIYLEMNGRLGNQLFRYAFARNLQIKYGEKLAINFRNLGTSENIPFTPDIKLFNIIEFKECNKEKLSVWSEGVFYQKLCVFLFKNKLKLYNNHFANRFNFEQKYSKILEKLGIYWLHIGEINYQFNAMTKNKFIIGCYESTKFFDEIRNQLLVELTPKKEVVPENIKLYELIKMKNSICISIRRGDFISNSDINDIYNLCDYNYFEKAMKLIDENIDNPFFVIFSDDIEWVKKNWSIKYPHVYESGNDDVAEKLRLMYSCKHFIISNSTFSWWAQYLSRNEDKIVVSPSRWYASNFNSALIEPSWIKIEV